MGYQEIILRVKSLFRKIDNVKETRYTECEYLESWG